MRLSTAVAAFGLLLLSLSAPAYSSSGSHQWHQASQPAPLHQQHQEPSSILLPSSHVRTTKALLPDPTLPSPLATTARDPRTATTTTTTTSITTLDSSNESSTGSSTNLQIPTDSSTQQGSQTSPNTDVPRNAGPAASVLQTQVADVSTEGAAYKPETTSPGLGSEAVTSALPAVDAVKANAVNNAVIATSSPQLSPRRSHSARTGHKPRANKSPRTVETGTAALPVQPGQTSSSPSAPSASASSSSAPVGQGQGQRPSPRANNPGGHSRRRERKTPQRYRKAAVTATSTILPAGQVPADGITLNLPTIARLAQKNPGDRRPGEDAAAATVGQTQAGAAEAIMAQAQAQPGDGRPQGTPDPSTAAAAPAGPATTDATTQQNGAGAAAGTTADTSAGDGQQGVNANQQQGSNTNQQQGGNTNQQQGSNGNQQQGSNKNQQGVNANQQQGDTGNQQQGGATNQQGGNTDNGGGDKNAGGTMGGPAATDNPADNLVAGAANDAGAQRQTQGDNGAVGNGSGEAAGGNVGQAGNGGDNNNQGGAGVDAGNAQNQQGGGAAGQAGRDAGANGSKPGTNAVQSTEQAQTGGQRAGSDQTNAATDAAAGTANQGAATGTSTAVNANGNNGGNNGGNAPGGQNAADAATGSTMNAVDGATTGTANVPGVGNVDASTAANGVTAAIMTLPAGADAAVNTTGKPALDQAIQDAMNKAMQSGAAVTVEGVPGVDGAGQGAGTDGTAATGVDGPTEKPGDTKTTDVASTTTETADGTTTTTTTATFTTFLGADALNGTDVNEVLDDKTGLLGTLLNNTSAPAVVDKFLEDNVNNKTDGAQGGKDGQLAAGAGGNRSEGMEDMKNVLARLAQKINETVSNAPADSSLANALGKDVLNNLTVSIIGNDSVIHHAITNNVTDLGDILSNFTNSAAGTPEEGVPGGHPGATRVGHRKKKHHNSPSPSPIPSPVPSPLPSPSPAHASDSSDSDSDSEEEEHSEVAMRSSGKAGKKKKKKKGKSSPKPLSYYSKAPTAVESTTAKSAKLTVASTSCATVVAGMAAGSTSAAVASSTTAVAVSSTTGAITTSTVTTSVMSGGGMAAGAGTSMMTTGATAAGAGTTSGVAGSVVTSGATSAATATGGSGATSAMGNLVNAINMQHPASLGPMQWLMNHLQMFDMVMDLVDLFPPPVRHLLEEARGLSHALRWANFKIYKSCNISDTKHRAQCLWETGGAQAGAMLAFFAGCTALHGVFLWMYKLLPPLKNKAPPTLMTFPNPQLLLMSIMVFPLSQAAAQLVVAGVAARLWTAILVGGLAFSVLFLYFTLVLVICKEVMMKPHRWGHTYTMNNMGKLGALAGFGSESEPPQGCMAIIRTKGGCDVDFGQWHGTWNMDDVMVRTSARKWFRQNGGGFWGFVHRAWRQRQIWVLEEKTGVAIIHPSSQAAALHASLMECASNVSRSSWGSASSGSSSRQLYPAGKREKSVKKVDPRIRVELDDRFGSLYTDFKGTNPLLRCWQAVRVSHQVVLSSLLAVAKGGGSLQLSLWMAFVWQSSFTMVMLKLQPYCNRWLGFLEGICQLLQTVMVLVLALIATTDNFDPGKYTVLYIQLSVLGITLMSAWVRVFAMLWTMEGIYFVMKQPPILKRLHTFTSTVAPCTRPHFEMLEMAAKQYQEQRSLSMQSSKQGLEPLDEVHVYTSEQSYTSQATTFTERQYWAGTGASVTGSFGKQQTLPKK